MTLLELLEQYNVEIPIIQRDYAQGRKNARTNAIRRTLLHDIRKAVLKETPPLDLNFVYGSVKDDKFIPIDGQQRLTTLFLLYLYALKNDNSKTELLKKFTYETRATSRQFFEEIIAKRSEIFNTSKEYPKPSDIIIDSSDFVASYKYDPTIRSALVMLDDVAAMFADTNELAERLQSNEPPVTFNFLNIENLGSEDELYIKLNARGKPLTKLENFKAKLLGRLKELPESENFADFESKFDETWTDLFWQRGNYENYETEYYNFFRIMLFNHNLIVYNDANWVQTLNYGDIPAEVFSAVYNLMNFLCDNRNTKAAELVFNALNDPNPTAAERVNFHIVSVFLQKRPDLANSIEMDDWVRVFGNLARNTIIDNYETALNIALGINDFVKTSEHLTNVLQFVGKIKQFNTEQLKEEIIKAQIILSEREKNGSRNGEFETAILSAEKLPFFDGQIRAGLYLAKDNNMPFGYDLIGFKDYWVKIEAIFSVCKPSDKRWEIGILLRRALLSLGDFTLETSSYRTLCSDHNDERGCVSLKELFSRCGKVTTAFLEEIKLTDDLKKDLQTVIDRNIKAIPQTDWRYCLITYPALFEFMSPLYYRIRFYAGYKSSNVLLVNNCSSSGLNAEVFTTALKFELSKRGIETKFDAEVYGGAGKTTFGDYYIIYYGVHGKMYFIEYDGNSFIVSDRQENVLFKSTSAAAITETADYIEKNLKANNTANA